MLSEGRIPMTPEEETAVNELIVGATNVSFTRRDPGETGPVLVQTDGHTYEVDGSDVKEV